MSETESLTPMTLRALLELESFVFIGAHKLQPRLRAHADAWEKSLTLPDGAIYLGKPTEFWYALLNLSRERGYEESVDKIVALTARLGAAARHYQEHVDCGDGCTCYRFVREWEAALAREETPSPDVGREAGPGSKSPAGQNG